MKETRDEGKGQGNPPEDTEHKKGWAWEEEKVAPQTGVPIHCDGPWPASRESTSTKNCLVVQVGHQQKRKNGAGYVLPLERRTARRHGPVQKLMRPCLLAREGRGRREWQHGKTEKGTLPMSCRGKKSRGRQYGLAIPPTWVGLLLAEAEKTAGALTKKEKQKGLPLPTLSCRRS